MHRKCVPICNNLLQIGAQLHCKCVPTCNKLLQFGTQLHFKWIKLSKMAVIEKMPIKMETLVFRFEAAKYA